jgi:hypothetical protein
MQDLLELLGKSEDDPVFVEYCREIEKTGSRDVTEDTEYIDYLKSGICFHVEPAIGVSTIFIYSEGHEEHRAFQGDIPNGLVFGQSREQVRSQFPVLLKEGGGQIGMLGKKVPIWDLFLWKLNHVHVQYTDDLAVANMITLMSPKADVPVSKSASDEKLIIFCIPSLVATLLNRERTKGSPLTEEEVLSIRDNAPAIALTPDVAREVAEKRGYPDIDADNVWEEWKKARLDLI